MSVKKLTESERVTRELAAAALQKRAQGRTPTVREVAALRKIEQEEEEAARWEYYASVPAAHYIKLSGRHKKVLHEQALRYGLPLNLPTINLLTVIKGMHDILATIARHSPNVSSAVVAERNGAPAPVDPMLNGGSGSDALERYRDEKAKLARLDRLQRERELMPVDDMRDGLTTMATLIRNAGDKLQRKFGVEAQEILDEAIDGAMHVIETMFAKTEQKSPETQDEQIHEEQKSNDEEEDRTERRSSRARTKGDRR